MLCDLGSKHLLCMRAHSDSIGLIKLPQICRKSVKKHMAVGGSIA